MRKRLILALLSLAGALPLCAVQDGDTLAAVIAEKGEPKSRLERGTLTVLAYSDSVVRLENGVVVSQKNPGADYAVRSQPVSTKAAPRSRTSAGTAGEWTTDHAAALAAANGSGRKVLLFFTGSDWCGWCMKLDAEILGTSEFRDFARENLVLLKLDFPRRSQLPDQVRAQNSRLQQQYGIEGYPTIVVLNDAGQEVGRLGYQRGGPAPFLTKLQRL